MPPRAVCQSVRDSLLGESFSRPRGRGFVAVLLFLIASLVGAASIIEGFELEAPLLKGGFQCGWTNAMASVSVMAATSE